MTRFHGMVVMAAVALVVTVAATATETKSNIKCSVPTDELAVFSSYLEWSAENTPTVLVTTSKLENVNSADSQLAGKVQAIPLDALLSLKSKDHQECTIAFTRPVGNVQFITKSKYDAMFRDRRGWTKFHKRFGENAHLEILSRVGFSSDKHVAVFYVTDGIGWMGVSCSLYVFELRNGRWVHRTSMPVWTT